MHKEKYKEHKGEARKIIVAEYKKKLMQQTSTFSKVNTDNELSLAASYEVSLQLAKAKKPFSDGVLIKKNVQLKWLNDLCSLSSQKNLNL